MIGLVLFALTLAVPAQAVAEERIALVIGNSQYRKVTRLINPANDSADMAVSLRRLGFNVKHLTDLDYDAFRRALIEFGTAAQSADLAVIFFAGHGVEIDGKNWLIPVDAEITSEINVYAEAINLETLIDISVMPKMLGLVVLDACRNNPFLEVASAESRSRSATANADKSAPAVEADRKVLVKSAGGAARPETAALVDTVTRGLAPIEPAENVLVAFAAAAGTTANDGQGRNSPYTSALLRHVETPGLEINYLFRNVHDDVLEETKLQQPALYGTLSKDEIFLKAGEADYLVANADEEAERLTWPFIQATNDIGTLRQFVAQFPSSQRANDVRTRIEQLEGAERFAWTIVERQNTASAYRAFTELYPYSGRVETARVMMASLETSQASDQSVDLPKPPAPTYQLASNAPGSTKSMKKNTASVEKAWQVLQGSQDDTVVSRFTESFPSPGRHAALAARRGGGDAPPVRLVNATQWLFATAHDDDVNGCFSGRPNAAAACVKAIEKYPDYAQLRFQLCKAAGRPDGCMTAAVEDSHTQGHLISAYTRSEKEKQRNRLQSQIQQSASTAASSAASAAAAAGAAAGSAAGAAAAIAASRAAPVIIPAMPMVRVAPVVVPTVRTAAPAPNVAGNIRVQSAAKWDVQLTSLKTALATPGAVTPAGRVTGAPVRVPGAGAVIPRGTSVTTPTVAIQTPSGGTATKTPSVNIKVPAVGTKVPDVKAPTVRAPNVKVTAPNVRAPQVRVPTVRVPTVRVPTTKVPSAPAVTVPTIRVR